MRTRAGRLFPSMALAAMGSAFLAVTMGGVVRVTGSGLGCPDWPLCHGRLVPPAELGAWLEYTHRLSVVGVSLFTVLTVITGFGRYTLGNRALYLVLLVPLLLLVQVILGAVTVLLELSPEVALAHTGVATIFVGLLALVVSGAGDPTRWVRARSGNPKGTGYWWLLLALGVVTFLVVLSGAYVTRTGASLACTGLPLCDSGPGGMGMHQWVHMTHRGLAVLAVGLMALVVALGWVLRYRGPFVITGVLSGVLILQIGLGVTNVALQLPMWSRAAHMALGLFFFTGVMWTLGTLWRSISRTEGGGT